MVNGRRRARAAAGRRAMMISAAAVAVAVSWALLAGCGGGSSMLWEPDDPDRDGVPTDGNRDGLAAPNGGNPCLTKQREGCDDNCPLTANPDQEDLDGDGAGDVCDLDPDGDGVLSDGDGDGLAAPDGGQPCDDDEHEGCDDNCPMVPNGSQGDNDDDGLGDACDGDDDDDGVGDEEDCRPFDPRIQTCDQLDIDKDGVYEDGDEDGTVGNDPCESLETVGCDDNCPGTWNPDQLDTDGDGDGDACDDDMDGDGVLNDEDCAPLDAAIWEFCDDPDRDGIRSDGGGSGFQRDQPCGTGQSEGCDDNCPLIANPDQLDTEGDGYGDICDPDDDGDGSPDAEDCAPLDPSVRPATDIYPAPLEACNGVDDDCDGTVDLADPFAIPPISACTDPDADGDGILSDGDGSGVILDAPCDTGQDVDCDDNCPAIANPGQTDQDDDGLGDACDPDRDGDNVLNQVDCEPDNIFVTTCVNLDPDGDGILSDGDGSGLPADAPCPSGVTAGCDDNCPTVANPGQVDSDGDGLGDACDGDDDNDGSPDDLDDDGVVDPEDDCAPLDPAVYPGAPELCDSRVNDCLASAAVADDGASALCGTGSVCACGGCEDAPGGSCVTFEAAGGSWAACSAATPLSWVEAAQRCADWGGHLGVIPSQEIQAVLAGRVNTPAWIGLTDEAAEGVWRSEAGAAATFVRWCEASPAGGAAANCALMAWDLFDGLNPGTGAPGCWSDCGCDGLGCGVRAYVCELDCP